MRWPMAGHASNYQGQRVGKYLHQGERVGRYLIGRALGAGGMGQVYEATDLKVGRRVAIKFLSHEHAANKALAVRFDEEARAACAIDHPGIVQVSDAGHHDDGAPYLVMELLSGESLRDRLDRRAAVPLSFDLIRGIARQMAEALAATHARGIVHRDLKPENIFLVPDTRMRDELAVKIIDFGIAKPAEGMRGHHEVMTVPGAVMGTPQYMSPEQIRNVATVDHRTDIYAFGMILYEMICGALPFKGTFADVLSDHLHKQPPAPSLLAPEVPADLERITLSCIAKEADRRFQSMEELQRALGPRTSTVPFAAQPIAGAGSTLVATDPLDGVAARPGGTRLLAGDAGATVPAGAGGARDKTRILGEALADQSGVTGTRREETVDDHVPRGTRPGNPRSSGAANRRDGLPAWRGRIAGMVAGGAVAAAVTVVVLVTTAPSPGSSRPPRPSAWPDDRAALVAAPAVPAPVAPQPPALSEAPPAAPHAKHTLGVTRRVPRAQPVIASPASPPTISKRPSMPPSTQAVGTRSEESAIEGEGSGDQPSPPAPSNQQPPGAPARADDPLRAKPFQ